MSGKIRDYEIIMARWDKSIFQFSAKLIILLFSAVPVFFSPQRIGERKDQRRGIITNNPNGTMQTY
jgi:hypothetical protein